MTGRQPGIIACGSRKSLRTPRYDVVLAEATDPKAVRQFLVEHVGGVQAVEENHSRFFRPSETWLTTTEPAAPLSVSKVTMAPSSVATAVGPTPGVSEIDGRSVCAFAQWATSLVIRCPVDEPSRSHQCTPMSPKARDVPPSFGINPPVGDLPPRDNQSCR